MSAEFEASAKTMAEEFARTLDVGLDFSKDSLQVLDKYLLGRRDLADWKPNEQVEVAIAAGAYLAEVLRRRAPVTMRWVPSSVLPGVSDPLNPFLLSTPKNLVFAVLGKPHHLLAKGASESLVRFADSVQDLCSRELTSGA